MARFSESDEDEDEDAAQEVGSSLMMLRQKTGLIKILELMQMADQQMITFFFSGWHTACTQLKWERLQEEAEAASLEISRVQNSASVALCRRVRQQMDVTLKYEGFSLWRAAVSCSREAASLESSEQLQESMFEMKMSLSHTLLDRISGARDDKQLRTAFAEWVLLRHEAKNQFQQMQCEEMAQALARAQFAASGTYARLAMTKFLKGALMEAYNHWKSIYTEKKQAAYDDQMNEVSGEYAYFKMAVADRFYSKNAERCVTDALVEVLGHWKAVTASAKRAEFNEQRDDLAQDLFMLRNSASEAIFKRSVKMWSKGATAKAISTWSHNCSNDKRGQLTNQAKELEHMIRAAAAASLGSLENGDTPMKRMRRVRKIRKKPPKSISPRKSAGRSSKLLGLGSDTRCSLVLKMNIATIAAGTPKRAAFEKDIVADIVNSLGVDQERVVLESVEEEGTRVKVRMTFLAEGEGCSALELGEELACQSKDSGSELYSGEITWRTDRSYTQVVQPPFEDVCLSPTSSGFGADEVEEESEYESYYEDEEEEDEAFEGGDRPVAELLELMVQEIQRCRGSCVAQTEKNEQLGERAAITLFQRSQWHAETVGLTEVFNHWKNVVSAVKEETKVLAVDSIKEDLKLMKFRAADFIGQKVLSQHRGEATAECMRHWKRLTEIQRVARLEESFAEAVQIVDAQQQLTAEHVFRKATQHWEHSAITRGFLSWGNHTKSEGMLRLQEELHKSEEEAAMLEEKVTRLKAKLEKASSEKKALLHEVNRHVELLL